MKTLLLACCWLLLLGTLPAQATHLLGGEIQYHYVDARGPATAPFRYQVTALIYLNREPGSSFPNGRPSVSVIIEDRSTNVAILEEPAPLVSVREVTAAVSNCTGVRPPRVALGEYTVMVALPFVAQGYRALVAETARNVGITNLANSGMANMTLTTDMAPPTLPNTSPVFSDTAVALICQGDTSLLLNNAYDADGDRLSYSFGTPSAAYAPGYSQALPFGSGGLAQLDANTGLSRYYSTRQGKFVVAVDVREYRSVNGTEVLLGSTRRDIQLVVRACPANAAPAFSAATLATRSFTIIEGDSLHFPIVATDPEGQRVALRVSSVLLDGAGPFDASFGGSAGTVPPGSSLGSVSVVGTGVAGGVFRFASRCGAQRTATYDVVVTATDDACASQTVAAVFRITVNRAAAPAAIRGDSVVCAQNPGVYTAMGSAATAYHWTVQGGQLQGSATGRTVQVLWGAGPTGTLTVRAVTSCRSDSVSRTISIVPSNFVTLGPVPTICPGAAAELTASGAQSYTWTGGGFSGSGPRVVVSPTQTTTYVLNARNGNCTTSQLVTVQVLPLAINGPRTFCPEARTGLVYSATSFVGAQYQWAVNGGAIRSGQGSSSVVVDLLPGAPAATLQLSTSTGCSATLTLQPDNARPLLESASVSPGGQDHSVQLTLRVPELSPATGRLSVLRRRADQTAFQDIGSPITTETTFTDPNVDADAFAYTYRLELRNGCGTLLASQEHTTMRAQATLQQEPRGRSQGQAEISWTPYLGFPVQAYLVFRQVDEGSAELVATLPGSKTSLLLPSGSLGFRQCFRVQAQSGSNTASSAFSNETCLYVANNLGFYNIITPNGDGLNDALVIDNVALYPGNTLAVYNRWGREVYRTRDYGNTFGPGASPGLYYYLFQPPSGSPVKGWFEVVR